ncbi:MAG TPA: alpha/beta fold hydrolase [Gemmatimonadaceae bacterium]|nr:alpha/beta fold hydrolase [Gemmatimonadaceae bacterium]
MKRLPRARGGVALAVLAVMWPAARTQSQQPVFVEQPCSGTWGKFDNVEPSAVHCGTITLPQNRAEPRSTQWRPVVLPVVHIAYPYADGTPMLLLPGGPGESGIEGLEEVLLHTPVGQLAIRQRPVIAFDRRGLIMQPGRGSPDLGGVGAVSAATRDEASAALQDSMRARVHKLRSQGVEPRFFTTTDVVADIADVLSALGYRKVVLLGASYGTREALQFMRAHPTVVESAILDGVVPPQSIHVLDPAFIRTTREGVVGRIVGDCAADAMCSLEYPRLAEALRRLSDPSAAPLRLTADFGGSARWQTVEVPGRALLVTLGVAANAEDIRAAIPQLVEDLASGDTLRRSLSPQVVVAAAIDSVARAGSGPAVSLVYDIVLCGDHPHGAPQRGGRPTCDALSVPFGGPYLTDPVRSDIPTLLLASGYDAHTPPALATEAARTLSRAQRVEFPMVGHIAFAHASTMACAAVVVESFLQRPGYAPATECIDNAVPAFLPRSVEPRR